MQTVSTIHNQLGESPFWDGETLLWVDIQLQIIYRAAGNNIYTNTFDMPVTCLGKRQNGGYVVGTGRGFATWDGDSSQLEFLTNPFPDDRFNDGMVSPAGNFWAGTMSDGASAVLFRLATGGRTQRMVDGLTISNGLGWSPDHKTFYLTDTRRDRIYAYDYDVESDSIDNRRIFADTTDFDGKPDGLAIDSEGTLWSCMWGGGGICHYTPDGKLLEIIPVPAACPTNCTFGGSDLKTLYITSAAISDSDTPQAGNLFAFETDVAGQAENLCQI